MTDQRIRRTWRQIFVTTGSTMLFWAAAGMWYFHQVRQPFSACPSGTMYISSTCYYAWKWLLPLGVIGLTLLIVGLSTFLVTRQSNEEILAIGSGSKSLLAILGSIFVVPMVAALVLFSVQASDEPETVISLGEVATPETFFLELIGLAGLVLFSVALGVHLNHEGKRRRYLRALTKDAEAAAAAAEAEAIAEPPAGPHPGQLPPEGYAWPEVRMTSTATMDPMDEEEERIER